MRIRCLYLIGLDINRDYLLQVAQNHIMEVFEVGPSIVVYGRSMPKDRPLAVALCDDSTLRVLYSEPLRLHQDGESNCRGHYQVATVAGWQNDRRDCRWVDVIDDVIELEGLLEQAEQDNAYVETIDARRAEDLYQARQRPAA